jgi:lipooligosaccharide transport system ATP-binding protein
MLRTVAASLGEVPESFILMFREKLIVNSLGKGLKMNSSEVIVKARNLTKKYNHNVTAVDHIDFDVYKGECVGFLGPNGAGKTTTVRMIYCFLPVTEGELTVAGLNVSTQAREIKGMIGISPQDDNLDPDFTVIKNLQVYARYFGIPKEEATKRATQLLKFFALEEKKDASIYQLSGGMKRRLIMARALINEPRILLLDEPTTGLDPQGRHIVWDEIRSLRKQGVTIILTTHYMDEAAALCDRILIVDNGKIIQTGSPHDLIKEFAGEDVLEVELDEAMVKTLKEELPDAEVEVYGDQVRVFAKQHGVFERIIKQFPDKTMTIRNANLEDVFLKLTGRKLRE